MFIHTCSYLHIVVFSVNHVKHVDQEIFTDVATPESTRKGKLTYDVSRWRHHSYSGGWFNHVFIHPCMCVCVNVRLYVIVLL